jgi:hypothetical protein
MFNIKQTDTRYSQANPKFYNYIKKYGLESLDFGCLLITKNYPIMYSGLNLSEEEILFLKTLTQWDLLLTEQYFLYNLGLSLNVSSMVGTKESVIVSDETWEKMSEAHINLDTKLSKQQWDLIRAKAKYSWKNNPLDSDRRKAISELHGRAVLIKDYNQNVIEEYSSQLKVAEYL